MASAEEKREAAKDRKGRKEGVKVGKGHKALLCSLLMLSFVEAKNGCIPLGALRPISSPDKERDGKDAIPSHIT